MIDLFYVVTLIAHINYIIEFKIPTDIWITCLFGRNFEFKIKNIFVMRREIYLPLPNVNDKWNFFSGASCHV